MPKALDPDVKHRIVLESDRDKPKDKQPYFEYRSLTGREWRKVAEVADQDADAMESSSGAEQLDMVYQTCSIGLVGWGNMIDPKTKKPIPFDVSKLEDVIDPIEALTDLLGQLMTTAMLTDDDKKKSE